MFLFIVIMQGNWPLKENMNFETCAHTAKPGHQHILFSLISEPKETPEIDPKVTTADRDHPAHLCRLTSVISGNTCFKVHFSPTETLSCLPFP